MLQRMDAVAVPACVHWDPAGQDKDFWPIPSHPCFHPQPTLCSCRLRWERRKVLINTHLSEGLDMGVEVVGQEHPAQPSLLQEKAVGRAGPQPRQLQKGYETSSLWKQEVTVHAKARGSRVISLLAWGAAPHSSPRAQWHQQASRSVVPHPPARAAHSVAKDNSPALRYLQNRDSKIKANVCDKKEV